MNNITDEIKDRCNIVDVVGRYVKLKRTGSNYMGLCPFHGEKTPSFSVSEPNQFFHCFGCGVGGDVISFVMQIEHLDFMAAVARLADENGIKLEDFGYRNSGRNEIIYDINREAAGFFYKQLVRNVNPGLGYIRKRGLKDTTVKRFGMGYAPDAWSSLKDHLISKGFTEKQLNIAGLISSSHGKTYDKFRDRVIFPIINTRRRVIGFGGRTVSGKDPKYLNSPESPVFSKKNNLFGINLTGKRIAEADLVIIVEGYMDLVSLYEYGVQNTVATLGTALTENQCKMIARYTKNVVLSYDSDSAGRKAALRGVELLRASGLEARVLHVTGGKDPDEFVRVHGAEAYLKLVESAAPYGDYVVDSIMREHGGAVGDDRDREKFLSEVSRVLSGRLRPAEEENIIKKLSDITGFSEGTVRRELEIVRDRKRSSVRVENAGSSERRSNVEKNESGKAHRLESDLVRLVIRKHELIDEVKKIEDVFQSGVYHRIFLAIIENYNKSENTIDERGVMDSLEPAEAACFRRELGFVAENAELYRNPDRMFAECMLSVSIKKTNEKLELVNEMIRNYPKDMESDREGLGKLYSELESLTLELQELKGKRA